VAASQHWRSYRGLCLDLPVQAVVDGFMRVGADRRAKIFPMLLAESWPAKAVVVRAARCYVCSGLLPRRRGDSPGAAN